MVIAKENDLVSSNYYIRRLYVMLCFFLRNVFCIWMRKTFITLLFLCEFSHQQHNNISGLAASYKIFNVKAHEEIIRF